MCVCVCVCVCMCVASSSFQLHTKDRLHSKNANLKDIHSALCPGVPSFRHSRGDSPCYTGNDPSCHRICNMFLPTHEHRQPCIHHIPRLFQELKAYNLHTITLPQAVQQFLPQSTAWYAGGLLSLPYLLRLLCSQCGHTHPYLVTSVGTFPN